MPALAYSVSLKSIEAIFGGRKSFTPSSLFAASEPGGWYDPSDLTTLYQDAAGTTPVTAVEQPVGLVLDKRNTSYSVLFNGTSDLISAAASSAFAFGTGDFTLSAWINPANVVGVKIIIDCRSSVTGTPGPVVYLNGATLASAKNATTVVNSGGTVSANVWSFVELTRTSGNWRIFLNGSLVAGPTLDAIDYTNDSPAVVGRNAISAIQYFAGNIFNARILKGVGGETSVVPTAPLTAIAGTSLLTCGVSWSGNPALTSAGTPSKSNPLNTGTGSHLSQSTAAARPVLSARKNLLVNTETLSTQNVTVRAAQHVLSFWGTGTITLSGVSTAGPLVGTGANNRVYIAFTPTAGTLTLTVSGTVSKAQLEERP